LKRDWNCLHAFPQHLVDDMDDAAVSVPGVPPLMRQQEVIDFYLLMEGRGAPVWIDGGWSVDALLGKQTRPHKDLDIAIQQKHVRKLLDLLEEQGYEEIKLESARPHNFVLGDDRGHEIDVHVIVLDDKGNGIYGPPENGEMYPAASLTGTGIIDGHQVMCISPEWMIKFHSGYELKDKDFQDVSALCEKLSFDLPKEFLKWVK
jgi:lincosamide nucleotidyltransferase A/C/D/E